MLIFLLYRNLIFYNIKDTILVATNNVDTILTIFSGLIIFGVVSTKLPKFRELGDSSIYELGYFIIMGLLSITITYFESSIHGELLWKPFLEMFNILSVILIIGFILSKSAPFKDLINGNKSKKNVLFALVVFIFLGIFSSVYVNDINGVPTNVRSFVVMVASIFCGPEIGIPTAIISALFRYNLGGPTALACAISTFLSGVVGSLVYYWNDRRIYSPGKSTLLMFLFMGLDMLMIILLTPATLAYPIVNEIYAPMTFSATMGMVLVFIIYESEKEKKDISTEERVLKLEQEIDEYKQKLNSLETAIDTIKRK